MRDFTVLIYKQVFLLKKITKKYTFAPPVFRKSGIPEVSLKRRESLQNPTKNAIGENEDRVETNFSACFKRVLKGFLKQEISLPSKGK